MPACPVRDLSCKTLNPPKQHHTVITYDGDGAEIGEVVVDEACPWPFLNVLGVCKINFDFRNCKYIEFSDEFDFTIGSKDEPIVVVGKGACISLLLTLFRGKCPMVMISSLSIERRAFVNPFTGGIICVVDDFFERKEAFELIGKHLQKFRKDSLNLLLIHFL
jgi:hypothetical protein